MRLVTDLVTKNGDRSGSRPINAITPIAADKIYERIVAGHADLDPQGEKVIVPTSWR